MVTSGRFLFGKYSRSAASQQLLSVDPTEELNQFCHEPSPPGLMAGSKASAIISLEVLVKKDIILPVRISLEFLRTAIQRPTAVLIWQKDSNQSIGNLFRNLEKGHPFT